MHEINRRESSFATAIAVSKDHSEHRREVRWQCASAARGAAAAITEESVGERNIFPFTPNELDVLARLLRFLLC